MSLLAGGRRRGRVPLNLVVDGNSLSANFYTSIGTFDKHIIAQPALDAARATATTSCFAVSGHDWATMVSTHGPLVDAAWVDGATNVLVAWEGTNSEASAPSYISGFIGQYAADRRTVHPGWKILYVETIPRHGSPDEPYSTYNQNLIGFDNLLRTDPTTLGYDVFVPVRDHPAFGHDGTDPAKFSAYASFWRESAAPNYTHLYDPGKAPIAANVAAAIAGILA